MNAASGFFWKSDQSKSSLRREFLINLNISVFLLRQSIEIKSKSIFGIDKVYYQNVDYLPNSFFLDFIMQNNYYFELKNIDLKKIRTIFNWTNNCIHEATKPKIREIQYALKICKTFCDEENEYDDEGNKIGFRLFGL